MKLSDDEMGRIDEALEKLKPKKRGEVETYRHILKRAIALGHGETLNEVSRNVPVRGRRMLEFGCGMCWYAPLFLGEGAVSFTGFDMFVDFTNRNMLDRVNTGAHLWKDAHFEEMPLSLEEFLSAFEGVELASCDILDVPWPDASFDSVFSLTVSEHLMDVRGALCKISDLLVSGGSFYLTHGNYYCWNGHHLSPKFVKDYDSANEAMVRAADWNHVLQPISNHDCGEEYLNQIRIHELASELKRLFEIEHWELTECTKETGLERFTDDIRVRLPEYYREELLTELVSAVCVKPINAEMLVKPSVQEVIMDDHRIELDIRWSMPEEGYCRITRIPAIGNMRFLTLYEDNQPMGPADASHEIIRLKGEGAYSLWGNYLYFSSSDNSDISKNGRRYVLR